MSEIKGQLLGVVLVIAIFGAIAGILYGAFQKSAKDIATKIEEDPTIEPQPSASSTYQDLLTF